MAIRFRRHRRRGPRHDVDHHHRTASRPVGRAGWVLGAMLVLTAAGDLGGREIEVTGRILGRDGQGLAGAEVELLALLNPHEDAQRLLAGSLPEAIAVVSSDRAGRFRIAASQPGMWRIVVRHPAHLAMTCHLRPLLHDRTVPEIRLPQRSLRSFKVVDEQGRPVAGLFLAAVSWSMQERPPEGWMPETLYLETAADGTVTVAAHPEGRLLVAAVRDDRFLLESLEWDDQETELRLTEPMLPVRLVDARGRPAADIYGGFQWLTFFPFGKSGDNGEILVPSRPERGVRIAFVDVHGAYPSGIATEKSDEERVLRLPAVTMLDGRVLDPHQTPIAGALVWNPQIHLRTDRSGSFRLRVAGTRETGLQVAAPGFLIKNVRVSPPELADGSERTVILEPAREVRGRVVNPDGEGVAGAALRARPGKRVEYSPDGSSVRTSSPDVEPQTATSGADGRFVLRGLAPDLPYRVEARRSGYAPAEVRLPAGTEPEELVLTLEAGLRVFGQVLDGDGQPIAGAEVRLIPERRSQDPFGRDFAGQEGAAATTDASGRFELRDLWAGIFGLRAAAPGYAYLTVPGIEITADPTSIGEPGLDLGTVVLEAPSLLRGRVTDREGRPLEGAWVIARSMQEGALPVPPEAVETGPDGSFELDVPPSGVDVMVHRDGFQGVSTPGVVPDPEKPLHIVLDPAITLAGQVVDAWERPVPEARVELRHGSRGGGGPGFFLTTDAEGRFEHSGLVPGRVTLGAHSETGIADPLEIDLAAGSERREVRLVLHPAGRLRGRVIDADGAAVAKAQVVVEPQTRGALELQEVGGDQRHRTDAGGRFTAGGLRAGSYRLRVSHPELEPVTEVIELTAGVTREVELVMGRRHARLRMAGQVIGPGGAVGGAMIRLVDAKQREVGQSTSAPSGAFEVSAPRPGEYALLVDHPGYAFRRTELLRVDGALDGVVVELDQGSVVSGEIHGLEAAQLARLEISLTGHGGLRRRATVSYDGRYRITGIPEGEWPIHAWMPPGPAVHEKVKVGPPGDVMELDLHFTGGHRLRGLALVDGVPLGGAEVVGVCGQRRRHLRQTTGSDGRFALDRVPSGRCQLTLTHYEKGISARREVEIEGDREVVVDLRPTAVSGQVLSAADLAPLAGVRVELFFAADAMRTVTPAFATRTDAEGRFTVAGVEPGVWQLRASATGHAMAFTRLEVGAGSGEVRILMNRGVRAEIVVLNPDGTVPPSVTVTATGGSGPPRTYRFQPDAEGRIVVDVLPAGTWSLLIFTTDGRARVEVEIPGPPVGVELTFPWG